MRYVVSAVEIVVDEDFPIAMNIVSAAIEVMQLVDAERSDARHDAAKEFMQRGRVRIEIDKDETLPGFNPDRQQAVVRALEVLHALEFRHAFQRSVEAVFPAVIGTLQDRGLS